jgi:hypothetical protein
LHLNIRRKIALGVTGLAVAAFAGGAYAATQESGANARQAFLNDVAKRLHVTPQQLTAAAQGAALDQLSAAVAAGKLTLAQANAIKQHIQQNGGAPLGPFLFGRPGPPGAPSAPGAPGPPGAPSAPGFFHGPQLPSGAPGHAAGRLGAVATYLGLSDTQLFNELAKGKSLAQIAKARGKSTSGLKNAIVASIKLRLDKAVAGKLITSAQEQQTLSMLSAGLDAWINHGGPLFGRAFRYRYGPATRPAPRAFRYGSGPVTPAQGPVGPIA